MNSRTVSSGVLLCCAALYGLAAATSARAQNLATYMHIDGVEGDAPPTPGHPNDIALTGYSQSFGTKNCSKVVALKSLDRSSPALISRAAGNVLIPSVIISIVRTGGKAGEFFKAFLETVLIERVDVGTDSGPLTEQIVLKPRNIRIEYRPQAQDGSLLPPIVSYIECT